MDKGQAKVKLEEMIYDMSSHNVDSNTKGIEVFNEVFNKILPKQEVNRLMRLFSIRHVKRAIYIADPSEKNGFRYKEANFKYRKELAETASIFTTVERWHSYM